MKTTMKSSRAVFKTPPNGTRRALVPVAAALLLSALALNGCADCAARMKRLELLIGQSERILDLVRTRQRGEIEDARRQDFTRLFDEIFLLHFELRRIHVIDDCPDQEFLRLAVDRLSILEDTLTRE